MGKLKSLLKFAIGGVGAIVGMGLLAGCGDEQESKDPQVKVTKAEIAQCCGQDDGSKSYESCVETYRTSGICGWDPRPKPVYGMPGPSDEELKACCDDRVDEMDPDECMAEYKRTWQCPEEVIYSYYGMPTPSDEELKACCDNRKDGMDSSACKEQYRNTFECPEELLPAPVYGMPEPQPAELKACCENRKDDLSEADCIEEYKQTNQCPEEVYYSYYGPAISEQELKACCENREDGMDADACIEAYMSTYQCPADEPVYADYGMPMPSDEDLKACCDKRNDGMDADKCRASYKENGICPPDAAMPDDPPIAVYGPAPISDKDIEECCGDQSGDAYDKCVKTLKETYMCVKVIEPEYPPAVYGPAPAPTPIPAPTPDE